MAELTSTPSNSKNANLSCFQPTVCLYEWWLVKAKHGFEGKQLAIGGIASKREEVVRVFTSAPIAKRHDLFSLETTDGVYIIIRGFIDEQRTIDNGFPPEVFSHFLFGFPQNWESYAADLIRDESTIGTDLGSAVPKNVSSIDPEIFSAAQEKSILSSSKPLKEAFGAHGKPHAEGEWYDSNATCGVNAAQGSGSIRRVTRYYNRKVCQQKQAASGITLKHPEELNSPVTPAQLQSLEKVTTEKVNTPSEHLDESSTSRVSRTLFENEEGCSRRKKATSEKGQITCERKMARSATATKYPRKRGLSPSIIGEKEKISSVSALSSFKKSRSGRLLLPPLEFWRNQIPIYNADHEVTEIQGGASVVQ
ncbi:hypothetical protein HN51_036779 [Arachis hypogaea]|uniref:SANTA domain-containing protein n=1 Tax=Arachis hypogaea TaxID=3818 RepID=A0A444ZYQ1_ARAHY|nr:uncharacterized protein LOC107630859 [Arachis ipaensis]XP_016189611.1 uncharacterized protein LOC107630859 [Arachis ipaensis]XP_016189612.1 uncharacterized protein LOC107630859 [Arachis ipaensis]XP_016189613.1 uncharacterized protein LOC107630859 [Arachis ipaensis]XP_016189616.1 uncharacterized protein LOC107630859 [Arachis ipaensis]XP_020974887.1 uncharacterized protein LOC107630859 [Arachis ipaensis]XP_020974889.1 uncharacterized protein LOC107630859 [Arachis ipaensis]XP_020974890.1 unc